MQGAGRVAGGGTCRHPASLSPSPSVCLAVDCKESMVGGGYMGVLDRGVSGSPCMPWREAREVVEEAGVSAPWGGERPPRFPDGSGLLESGSACRNPTMSAAGPWCYVRRESGGLQRETCDVPLCREYAPPSVRPTVRPYVRPSIGPSVRPSVHLLLSVHLSVHSSVRPSVCPSVCTSVCPSVRPPIRPSARPPAHPSVRPSVCPSVRLSVRPPIRPSARPPAHPSIC